MLIYQLGLEGWRKTGEVFQAKRLAMMDAEGHSASWVLRMASEYGMK